MQKCYKCLRQFEDHSIRFCPYCGTPLAIDKEWAEEEKRKKEKEESARRAREAAEAERKKNSEAAAPYLSKLRALTQELNELRKPGLYYVPFPEYYSLPNLDTKEGLEGLKKEVQLREDYMAAHNNNGDKALVDRLVLGLKEDLAQLEELITKLKGYNAYQSADYKAVLELVNAFTKGGKVTLAHNVSDNEVPYDASGKFATFEPVSASLIPDAEIKKLIGYRNASDFTFVRIKVYNSHSEYSLYVTFPYGGISSFIRGITYTARDWGTKYLMALTDIHTFTENLKKYTAFYTWHGLSTGLRNDFQNIYTGEMTNKNIGPIVTFDHYDYLSRPK